MGSLNQLSNKKTLDGYIVVKSCGHDKYYLALNYSNSIVGMRWGFDWVNRATVFKTKKEALKYACYIGDIGDPKISVRRVKDFATLIPEINSRYEVTYVAKPIADLVTLDKRVARIIEDADKIEQQANKQLKLSQSLRKKARILANVDSKY